jgi:hypothetical protein
MEEYIVRDNTYYRVLSLSAVFNPELFAKNFLKAHFDFLCSFYRVKSLSFTNIPSIIFSNNSIEQGYIYDWLANMQPTTMFIYNIFSEGDDYLVYKTENLISIGGGNARKINKMTLQEFMEQNIMDIANICINLNQFYQFSPKLQNNKIVKKTTLENMQKLSNLQKESYTNFTKDILLLL